MTSSGALCAWCSRAGSGTDEIYTKDAWLSRGALLACSSCHSASYCSLICQKRHWPLHKKDCPRLKARWLATEGERRAAAEQQRAERRRQLEADAVLVRQLVADIELGLERLDPSASLRWVQKRPGRVDVVEVWLHGRKYTGFDTITRHTSVEATLAAIEYRMQTGTVGYGCPCHGFNMMLLNSSGPNQSGKLGAAMPGAWTPCPYGGAGARREVRAPLGSLPAGFVARPAAQRGAGTTAVWAPTASAEAAGPEGSRQGTAAKAGEQVALGPGGQEAANSASLALGFFGFSCEPCDPDEARLLAAERLVAAGERGSEEAQGGAAAGGQQAEPPHPYALSAFGFSCTPCDPDDLAMPPGFVAPPELPGAAAALLPGGTIDAADLPQATASAPSDPAYVGSAPCTRDCPPACARVGLQGGEGAQPTQRLVSVTLPLKGKPCGDAGCTEKGCEAGERLPGSEGPADSRAREGEEEPAGPAAGAPPGARSLLPTLPGQSDSRRLIKI